MANQTLATSGAALIKAGTKVSTDFKTPNAASELKWDIVIQEAEGFIMTASREDWVANYAKLDSKIKLILEDFVSNWAAIEAIKYDMSGYTSRIEAEDIINVLVFKNNLILQLLDKDQKGVGFVAKSS